MRGSQDAATPRTEPNRIRSPANGFNVRRQQCVTSHSHDVTVCCSDCSFVAAQLNCVCVIVENDELDFDEFKTLITSNLKDDDEREDELRNAFAVRLSDVTVMCLRIMTSLLPPAGVRQKWRRNNRQGRAGESFEVLWREVGKI